MKWKPFKLPIAIRVFIFVLGVMFASFSVGAISSGKFDGGKTGHLFEVSMTRDPLAFWSLVVIFSMFSAGLFYVSFAKRYPDA